MGRTVLDAQESLGLWRYRIEHGDESFHQQIQRLPGGYLLEMTVVHLRYVPEGDGEWHEAPDYIRHYGPPYLATLDEALAEGDQLIRAWRSDT